MKELDINQLVPIESGGLDLTEYEGVRKRIENLQVMEVPSQFSKTGKALVIKVITEPVVEVINKEGKKVEIRATELFNLKQNEDGQWGWSENPKSRINKLLTKTKSKHPKDLIGKLVTIKVRQVTRQDGTTGEYLGFHID